jgi:MoaA/NifB/PqqE/SkfB family radical SAM enzyme
MLSVESTWRAPAPGFRTRAKVAATHAVADPLLRLLARSSDESLVRLVTLLERYVARYDNHKAQLQHLRDLFEQKHPALELARKVMTQLHPSYRRRLISNLGINATWLGEQIRRDFCAQFGVFPPYLMVISPTMRCNLKCLGCYAGEYPRDTDPMSFETIDRAVSEAKQMGIHMFTISGGEPFVRPDMLDLYEKHNDAVFQIYTNGTCISDATIERMQKLGNVAPAISIEGFKEETDFRRGPGVWEKVMETMDKLHEAGVLFGFSGTVTRLNAEAYLKDEFFDMVIDKGCLYGWFFMFVPVGQDASVDLMPTAEQRDAMRRKVMQVRRTRPIFAADFWNDGCLTGGCMSGGTLYLHLNFRGDLEPCVFMHFAADNIHDMYANGKHLWDVLKSPLFTAIRDVNRRDPNPLRPCPIVDHNEFLAEALSKVEGVYPTHKGAEDIIGRLAPQVREWSERYAEYADKAWNSEEYEWARTGSWLVPKEVQTPAETKH